MNLSEISQKIDSYVGRIGYFNYTRIYCPYKAFLIRRKPCIKVIFIITELGVWKSELLYLAMKAHPRFSPVLRVLPSTENDKAKEEVFDYLQKKQYDYEFIDKEEFVQKDFIADIIFYQKPYIWCYYPKHSFIHNKNALLCYVSYGIHNVLSDYICNQPLHNYVWQYYFENKECAVDTAKIMNNKGRNIKITGVPMLDAFLRPRSSYLDRWKPQLVTKKRIIWAPHFSFEKDSILHYSTFLCYCDFMIELAKKYVGQVQFLFKPHPLLQPRLYNYWGKERTDAYYAEWNSMENTQVGLGQYVDYFMTSDAMIHDCSSFTNEYIYTLNPVMYLTHGKDDHHNSNLNSFASQAYHLHYKGTCKEEIESFVQNVIRGRDEMYRERKDFYDRALLPPNGKSASDNIIDTILGKS